jgi:hypothetical protein
MSEFGKARLYRGDVGLLARTYFRVFGLADRAISFAVAIFKNSLPIFGHGRFWMPVAERVIMPCSLPSGGRKHACRR